MLVYTIYIDKVNNEMFDKESLKAQKQIQSER